MKLVSASGRTCLLLTARAAIHRSLGQENDLERRLEEGAASAELQEPHGAFVSLKLDGKLRGCIGRMSRDAPLFRNVAEIAPKAALEDPRFSPITAAELEAARIEISVLGDLRPLDRIEEIVIGRDGLELKKGSARSVFLPQVAAEHGWTVEQLLSQLSRKASLAEDAWRDAELSVFQGEHFSEGQ